MKADYKIWLADQEYAQNTQVAQLHRVQKVEQYYGSLDDAYAAGDFDKIVGELNYSVADEKAGKKNPSKILFDGNIRNNLQSYKNAVERYRKFIEQTSDDDEMPLVKEVFDATAKIVGDVPAEKQKLSLERDMQAALRLEISQLEGELTIIDDGAERAVASGFIDILCQDSSGSTVVVELKAGKTDSRVIGQILGYMGDLMLEDELSSVRGIIVAHEFDKRTRSASKAVPNIKLVKYSVKFQFEGDI